MTPESLERLVEEATPGPWTPVVEEHREAWVFEIMERPASQSDSASLGISHSGVTDADAALIALAPDLARIVIEQHRALERIAAQAGRSENHIAASWVAARARTALALLDGLGQ